MSKDKIIDATKTRERFIKKIDRSENHTKCHIWLASKNQTGHGMFSVLGKTIPASRCAFMMFRGQVAEHEVVTQTCFNPSCVNPEHLELSDKRRISKRLTIRPEQLASGSISFLNRLKNNTKIFRDGMKRLGFDIKPGNHPIVPIMLYDAHLAQKMSNELLDRGIYVIGFFFPVVPKGEARIRVQLSASHSIDQVNKALDAFEKVGKKLGVIN